MSTSSRLGLDAIRVRTLFLLSGQGARAENGVTCWFSATWQVGLADGPSGSSGICKKYGAMVEKAARQNSRAPGTPGRKKSEAPTPAEKKLHFKPLKCSFLIGFCPGFFGIIQWGRFPPGKASVCRIRSGRLFLSLCILYGNLCSLKAAGHSDTQYPSGCP